MGSTWLGGGTTYTTIADRCTKMVLFQCDPCWMFTLYFGYSKVCFHCDLCCIWDACISLLDDVSFN